MRIKSIVFYGFKNLKIRAKVVFNNETSILYGTNGSGKTTILRLISAVLSQNEEVLRKEKVDKVEITIEENEIEQHTYILSSVEERQSYDWSELNKSSFFDSKSILIGVERGLVFNKLSLDSSLINEFLISELNRKREDNNLTISEIKLLANNLTTFINTEEKKISKKHVSDFFPEGNHIILEDVKIDSVESALLSSYLETKREFDETLLSELAKILIPGENSSTEENSILQNDIYESLLMLDEMKEIVSNIENKNLKKVLSLPLENLTEQLNDDEFSGEENYYILAKVILEKSPIIIRILLGLKDLVHIKKEKEYKIIKLLKLFNSLLGDDKKLCIDNSGIKIKSILDGDESSEVEHSLSGLSSGERHLLTFLTAILIDGDQRDFILIDEPEISLNIIWKEKLVGIIRDLAPSAQIIVASHSQSIAQNHFSSLTKIEKSYID